MEKSTSKKEILRSVSEYYQSNILRGDNPALQFLNSIGISNRKVIDIFMLGYADGNVHKSCSKAQKDLLKEIGLLGDRGMERFRNALTFTITNEQGEVLDIFGIDVSNTRSFRSLSDNSVGIINWKACKTSDEIYLTDNVILALKLFQDGKYHTVLVQDYCQMASHVSYFKERLVKRINVISYQRTNEMIAGLEKVNAAIYRYKVKKSDKADVPLIHSPKKVKELKSLEDITLKTSGEEISVEFGNEHHYQIRAFKRHNRTSMRLVLTITVGETSFTDKVDLYAATNRSRFIRSVSAITGQKSEVLEKELLMIMDRLEEHRKQTQHGEKTTVHELSEEEKGQAAELLKDSNLINTICQDIEKMGYIGEPNSTLLGYLVAISRKLATPLSCMLLSSSGAGKSQLMDVISQLCPSEDMYFYSRLSATALYYMGRSQLKHKLVIVDERVGSADADYPIRTLQTAKKLSLALPIKDPVLGRTVTQTFEVEGPIAYMESTTDASVNPENANRCFEIYLDETHEQTRKIQQLQGQLRSGTQKEQCDKIIDKHHLMQRALRPYTVIIPYAEKIRFPYNNVRNRRDFGRFLSLIEAIAYLFQFQREKKSVLDAEVIEANMSDYHLAVELTRHSIKQLSGEVSANAVALIEHLVKTEENEFILSQLSAQLHWSYSKVYRTVRELEGREIILGLSRRPGQPRRYRFVEVGLEGMHMTSELLNTSEMVQQVSTV